jgi:hypothetical protein
LAVLFASAGFARASAKSGKKGGSWFFAVSGDSRDCGDLIIPKIAWSIEHDRAQAPVEFYWHLGDLRALYREDCDMLLRRDPTAKCPPDAGKGTVRYPFDLYLEEAWDDFIQNQITPFGRTPYVLGIGNHELINRPRDYFRLKFARWLDEEPILSQVRADAKEGVPSKLGSTYYHFVKKGVDFIYLDNAAGDGSFDEAQLAWLQKVLDADAKDKRVRTIIVGMHAALPLSSERGHAMDTSCHGVCTGLRAYRLIYLAQNLAAPPAERKHVYVLSSHSHFFRENIYDTPEHKGRVLPGWIIGTGGAEQYLSKPSERIMYGYMQVEVRSDGQIATQFKEVKRDTPPLATGPGADALTAYCFEQNRNPPRDDHKTGCQCAATP